MDRHESVQAPQMDAAGEARFVRAFVAVGLADDLRTALVAAIDRLRSSPARVTWVPGENLHLSLVFLGDIPVARIPDLAAAADASLAGQAPMSARVSGLGTFGPPRSPRVVWAGVEAAPLLIDLQARLANGFRALGLRREDRPFHPHITLGRVKAPTHCADLSRRIARIGETAFGVLPVNDVLLLRSELRPEHATYSPMHISPLR